MQWCGFQHCYNSSFLSPKLALPKIWFPCYGPRLARYWCGCQDLLPETQDNNWPLPNDPLFSSKLCEFPLHQFKSLLQTNQTPSLFPITPLFENCERWEDSPVGNTKMLGCPRNVFPSLWFWKCWETKRLSSSRKHFYCAQWFLVLPMVDSLPLEKHLR